MSATAEIKNTTTDILASIHNESVLRTEAKSVLEKLGLPLPKNEEYRFAPVTRVLEKNFSSLSLPGITDSAFNNVASVAIPELDSYTIVFVNGITKTSAIPGIGV
jgi:hypothetical protein